MNPGEFPERLRELEAKIAAEKGAFVLFALFTREEMPDRWNLIVSAPWASADERAAVDYFVAEIKSYIGEDALTNLSRIVSVNPHEAAMQALNRAIQVEHGSIEVRDREFFGLPISKPSSSRRGVGTSLPRPNPHSSPGQGGALRESIRASASRTFVSPRRPSAWTSPTGERSRPLSLGSLDSVTQPAHSGTTGKPPAPASEFTGPTSTRT